MHFVSEVKRASAEDSRRKNVIRLKELSKPTQPFICLSSPAAMKGFTKLGTLEIEDPTPVSNVQV